MRLAVCDASIADAQELVVKLQHLAADMGISCTVNSYRGARTLLEAAKENAFDAVPAGSRWQESFASTARIPRSSS